jgi:starch synthase
MKILMVTSEAVPFSKSGGLADVVGSLSAALVRQGDEVAIVMPAYGNVDLTGFSKPLATLSISLRNKIEQVTARKQVIDGISYLALCHPLFTERKGIYGDTSFAPYPDNFVRFMLMDKAVLPLCLELDWKPDVIHCHDWTAGIVPFLLRTSENTFFAKTKSILTIHNLAYQGDFARLDAFSADFIPEAGIFMGTGPGKRINMLKAGLVYADRITTVSPTYAKQIQEPEYGCKLDGILRERSGVLTGILNGIDYNEWNSMTDRFFTQHFSSEDLHGKSLLKAEIQKEFKLETNADVPLISMISRLAEQKGFVELLEGEPCALERMAQELRVQFLIIGTGDEYIQNKLHAIGERNGNVSVQILFSNEAAHRIEGGSDFFLMPSRYEPCGLNQLYSLRYGTLPIARRTGGLADTIVDFTQDRTHATGFLFTEMSGHGIEEAVKIALRVYEEDSDCIETMRTRGMQTDFTWDRSAKEYHMIYTMGETK